MDPILAHHFKNLAEGKTVTNEDGTVSSIFTIQADIDGKPTLIPTVWDGKILTPKEAIKKALETGIKWPTAKTHEDLRKYDIELHRKMEQAEPPFPFTPEYEKLQKQKVAETANTFVEAL